MSEKIKPIKQQKVISFRLNTDEYKALKEKANKIQMGPNEFVRAYVLSGIDERGALSIYSKRFDNLEKITKTVGLDLFFGVQQLLKYVTDVNHREWLKENMKALEWNVKE